MSAIHGYWKSAVLFPLMILLVETGPQIFRGSSLKLGWLVTSGGSSTIGWVAAVVEGGGSGQHTRGLLPLNPHWEFRRKSITSDGKGRVIVSIDKRAGQLFKSMHCPCLPSGVLQLSLSSETNEWYSTSLSCKGETVQCKAISISMPATSSSQRIQIFHKRDAGGIVITTWQSDPLGGMPLPN
jgi:hypothetical protein